MKSVTSKGRHSGACGWDRYCRVVEGSCLAEKLWFSKRIYEAFMCFGWIKLTLKNTLQTSGNISSRGVAMIKTKELWPTNISPHVPLQHVPAVSLAVGKRQQATSINRPGKPKEDTMIMPMTNPINSKSFIARQVRRVVKAWPWRLRDPRLSAALLDHFLNITFDADLD